MKAATIALAPILTPSGGRYGAPRGKDTMKAATVALAPMLTPGSRGCDAPGEMTP